MRQRLNNPRNTHGRIDVLLYRLAERWMEQQEQRGLPGLRQHLLPLVEAAIVAKVPAGNMIPPELRSLMLLCDENFRRPGC